MKRVIYILLIMALLPFIAMAQPDDRIQEAYGLYKVGMLHEAAVIIDDVVETKSGSSNPQAWHVRGFIYKDIYAKLDNSAMNSPARTEAINSFEKSMELDKENKIEEMNRLALKFLGVSYFNDASKIIDRHDRYTIDSAKDNYLKYKEVMSVLYPDSSFVAKDIEFNLAMSTAYRKIYEEDRENRAEYFEKSNESLVRVMELDPTNWAAYFSYSVSHYNKGAYNLQRLPNAEGIQDIYSIQSESIKSIEIALPYMLKAYELDPEKIDAIKALKWIYFNLHNEEESKKMGEIEQIKENRR